MKSEKQINRMTAPESTYEESTGFELSLDIWEKFNCWLDEKALKINERFTKDHNSSG